MDMSSQASDSNEEDFDDGENDCPEEEDQGDMTYYYEDVANDVEQQEAEDFDPEEYQFTCLSYRDSQRLLTEEVNLVSSSLKVCLFCCIFVHVLCTGLLIIRVEKLIQNYTWIN